MKTIVIAGAHSGVGKTTLARELETLLPNAMRVKLGHSPVKATKNDLFYPVKTPFAQIASDHSQADYLILESNSILGELCPDCVIYLAADNPKPSALLASRQAHIIRGEPVTERTMTMLAARLAVTLATMRRIAWLAGAQVEPATAVILAGGKSSRMGEDKAFLPIAGQPAVYHLHAMLQPYFAHLLVATSVDKAACFAGIKTVCDKAEGYGPLMAIYSALRESVTELNFVVACDIPYLHPPLVYQLMAHSDDYEIVVPSFAPGMTEPLLAVYRKTVVATANRLLEHHYRKVDLLFKEHKTYVLPVSDSSWYFNMNTPTDYTSYLNQAQPCQQHNESRTHE